LRYSDVVAEPQVRDLRPVYRQGRPTGRYPRLRAPRRVEFGQVPRLKPGCSYIMRELPIDMTLQAFKDRVLGDLLPKYCDHPSRGWGSAGFKPDWSKLNESDARDFLRALDANLVQHVGRGQYRAPRSAHKEQFFWTGPKNVTPRPFSLWIEPIIAVAGLARLHFEYGWPGELLGTESSDGAFDLATYSRSDPVNERVACEVKKSTAELDRLVKHMRQFAADNVQCEASKSKSEINAFRKLNALRDRKAPVFWALGPGQANYVFRMVYGDAGLVALNPSSEHVLYYSDAHT